ncbi:MAG: hypothetical protein IKY82_03830 [Alistipes sp.]|nr:hypothetical protein [Alistipes sp.]
MSKVKLFPTSSSLWRVGGIDCTSILRNARNKEKQGLWAEACDTRAEAAQMIIDAADDEAIRLDWEDENSRNALQIIYQSAADYLSVGEVETATALWESVIDFDEEDHLQATMMLAFCYVELEDFECLETVMSDISPKSAEYHLLTLWAEYRHTKGVDRDALRTLRTRHKAWYEEFIAPEHPADEEFLADRQRERPQPRTESREFWFATESIWMRNADFISALIKA